MNKLERFYEITQKDLRKRKSLEIAPWLAPIILAIPLPLLFFILSFIFAVNPASVAFFLFLAVISFIVSVLVGIVTSVLLLFYRQKWLAEMRQKISADGVKASEVDWFQNELTSVEKKSLAEVEKSNLLLGDALRETLASKITAAKIIGSVKSEMQIVQRRQSKLKYLKTENAVNLQNELKSDQNRLDVLKKKAEALRIDAETRFYQIETAARRGVNFSETELSLKQLSARTSELPLALQTLQMEEDALQELRKDINLQDGEKIDLDV